VEVDSETGSVRLDRFTAIDDVGRAINPMILFGQSHGGIAQGVGQALLEDCRYDAETGQLLSGSFMDYCLPRADDLPSIAVGLNEALSPVNVLGVKGAGESGSTGAPPAVINAITDALGECGVTHIDMPATPERVWRAIQAAANPR
jgi:carbon-monoxide dehydrogenase large subunit